MLVGITAQRIKHPQYSETGYYINVKWQELAKELGIKLVILHNITITEKLIKEKSLEAIILSGGGNLSKNFPKITKLNKSKGVDLEREKIEKKLINFSLKVKIPLIGVCRGMQAIGMFFNAKLSPVKNHVKSRHKLSFYCPVIKKNILINNVKQNYINTPIYSNNIFKSFYSEIDKTNFIYKNYNKTLWFLSVVMGILIGFLLVLFFERKNIKFF